MSGKTEVTNISTDFDMDSILGPAPTAENSTVTAPQKLEKQTSKPGDAPSKASASESPYEKSVRVAAEKEAKKAAKKKEAVVVTAPVATPATIDASDASDKEAVVATAPVAKSCAPSPFTKEDVKYLKDALVTVGTKISDINDSLKAIAATQAESLKLYKDSCEFQAKAILEVISKITEAIDTHNSKTIAVPVATTVAAPEQKEAPKVKAEAKVEAKTEAPQVVTLDMLKQEITAIVGLGNVGKKQAVMMLLEANNAKPVTSARPDQYYEIYNGLMAIKNAK